MAIKSNNITHRAHVFPVKKITQRKRVPLFNIEERILSCDFYSLRPIARRQAISYYKQLKYHPNRRFYIKMINLVILDDKLFRNLFFLRIYNKKSEEENE